MCVGVCEWVIVSSKFVYVLKYCKMKFCSVPVCVCVCVCERNEALRKKHVCVFLCIGVCVCVCCVLLKLSFLSELVYLRVDFNEIKTISVVVSVAMSVREGECVCRGVSMIVYELEPFLHIC